MDTGLYSLFSEYDRELLERYHLFFLDTSYRTGTVQISQVLNHLEDYMRPVLESGLTKCAVQICAADGFRIASDEKWSGSETANCSIYEGKLGKCRYRSF